MEEAGFFIIRIKPKDASRQSIHDWATNTSVEDYVVSATLEAIKPRRPTAQQPFLCSEGVLSIRLQSGVVSQLAI